MCWRQTALLWSLNEYCCMLSRSSASKTSCAARMRCNNSSAITIKVQVSCAKTARQKISYKQHDYYVITHCCGKDITWWDDILHIRVTCCLHRLLWFHVIPNTNRKITLILSVTIWIRHRAQHTISFSRDLLSNELTLIISLCGILLLLECSSGVYNTWQSPLSNTSNHKSSGRER